MAMPQTERTFTVSAPSRLDIFLGSQSDIKSRSSAQNFIKGGRVRVNGRKVKKSSFALEEGMTVTVQLPSPAAIPVVSGKQKMSVDVLYEDDDCMVINKPAGVIVHPGIGMKPGEPTLLDLLKPLFAKRKLPFSEPEVLVHRLDKDTTGCLLVAKTPVAHMKLQTLFQTRSIEKIYLALVMGVPSPARAVIDSPIGRHNTFRTKMSVTSAGKSRSARTIYETIASAHGASLLRCELQTGRTHQIRVHLSSVGHPILGDETYTNTATKELTKELKIDFLCLHAWKLSFVSPFTKKQIEVESPVPQDFQQLLLGIGINHLED